MKAGEFIGQLSEDSVSWFLLLRSRDQYFVLISYFSVP
jgi:hypothetical protein